MTGSALALAALLAPWCAAGCGAAVRRRQESAALAAAVINGIGCLAAVGLVIDFTVSEEQAVALGGGASLLSLDALAVVMLVFVLGLSALIQSFAVRYLRGDTRQGWFVVVANLLTASTIVVACASSVVVFVVGWLAAGISLVLALGTYSHDRQARDGVRRTFHRFVIGDACLLAGALTLISIGGVDLALSDVGGIVDELPVPLGIVVGLLLVVPALARSTQIPFHGWLPSTLAAPTPVSALLHAGVVNAGAILLIRFSPVITGSVLVMAVVFAAGAGTVVYASVLRLVKPDVKGRLVFSTMAQMGFMVMACGLGAFAAAVFHLVAHGLYKSALFLSASSGVNRNEERRGWPRRQPAPPQQLSMAMFLAVIISFGSVAGAVSLMTEEVSASSMALLGFVILTGAVALGATLRSRPSVTTGIGSILGIVLLTLAYTASVAAIQGFLGEMTVSTAVSPGWVLLPAVLLITIQWLASYSGRPSALHDALYAHSLTAGNPTVTPRKGTSHEPQNQS